MSLTALVWLVCYLVLVALAFVRPAWGIALYLLTFYLAPQFWWWGDTLTSLMGDRINLATALIFAMAVLVGTLANYERLSAFELKLFFLLVLYAVNATLIHYANANNPERSLESMVMLWKQIGLLLLIVCSLRSRFDMQLFIAAVLLGSLYFGYEVVINDRGSFSGGRMEGIGAPGAGEANYLAGLMLFCIPLAGNWLFFGNWRQRVLSIVTLVLILEVVLRCNSRGAYLGLICGGIYLLMAASGRARRYAVYGVVLGAVAALSMARDEDIRSRFLSIFASAEHRDASAQSRLDYWSTGLRMIGDHPAGTGGQAAFKSSLGVKYLRTIGVNTRRAVHNGYLDIAAAWGIQGFLLYLGAIGLTWWEVRKGIVEAKRRGQHELAFFGACIQAVLVTQLVSALFISSLDGEWFFWWFGLAVGYRRIYVGSLLASQPAWSQQVRWVAAAPSDVPAGRP